jgi:aminoglycoside phosphotransferase (APT) family kinase protein
LEKWRHRGWRDSVGEPGIDLTDENWVEWGGELIYAVGETSGGAPYGVSVEEFRWFMAESVVLEAPWVRARRALVRAFAGVGPGVEVEVGEVEAHGKGFSRAGYAAEVEVRPDPGGLITGTYVALVARRSVDEDYFERVHREARVLAWVGPRIRGVRMPRVVTLIGDQPAPILVESFVPGIVPDLRVGRLPGKPWEIVGTVAAAIHRVEPPPAHVTPARDRRQHRVDLLRELFPDGDVAPGLLGDAYAWMREHVDRPGPGVLLHGDLLGHNLRLEPGGETGVIDWEHAEIGDPAHDLAIVTRGVRRPFKSANGCARLLEAHARESRVEVTSADLRFFELALQVRWVQQRSPNLQEHQAAITRLLREPATAT